MGWATLIMKRYNSYLLYPFNALSYYDVDIRNIYLLKYGILTVAPPVGRVNDVKFNLVKLERLQH